MIVGDWKAATIASAGTSSAAVDLGREYETLLVYLPTITSATIKIQGAERLASTYADIYVTDPADGHDTQVISSAGEGAVMWVVPIGGFRYIKVVSSAAQGAERLIRVCGVRS